MNVLILIILEYIYMLFSRESVFTFFCLNPYYTGIHLHSEEVVYHDHAQAS